MVKNRPVSTPSVEALRNFFLLATTPNTLCYSCVIGLLKCSQLSSVEKPVVKPWLLLFK